MKTKCDQFSCQKDAEFWMETEHGRYSYPTGMIIWLCREHAAELGVNVLRKGGEYLCRRLVPA
jgi:hypothetical protein